jgi:hypothetical protein
MSPHTYITFPLKLTTRNKKEEVLSMSNKKVNELHMKTKCPKQLGHLLKEEDFLYAPHFEIKPHPKNVWQNPKNQLAHTKCVSHL